MIVGALELAILSVRIRRLTRGEAWREKMAGKIGGKIGGKNWRENDVKNMSGKIGGKIGGKNWREKIGGKKNIFLRVETSFVFRQKTQLFSDSVLSS